MANNFSPIEPFRVGAPTPIPTATPSSRGGSAAMKKAKKRRMKYFLTGKTTIPALRPLTIAEAAKNILYEPAVIYEDTNTAKSIKSNSFLFPKIKTRANVIAA